MLDTFGYLSFFGLLAELDEKLILKLASQGLGSREIAKRLGVKHSASVFKVLRRNGLKRDPNYHLVDDTGLKLNLDQKSFQEASELFAQYILTRIGFSVYKSEATSPYDFLVASKNGVLKIQVKSASSKATSGNFRFTLIRTRNNSTSSRKVKYLKEEVDYFLLVSASEEAWLIPFEKLKEYNSCIPEIRFPNYKVWPLGGTADAGDL